MVFIWSKFVWLDMVRLEKHLGIFIIAILLVIFSYKQLFQNKKLFCFCKKIGVILFFCIIYSTSGNYRCSNIELVLNLIIALCYDINCNLVNT